MLFKLYQYLCLKEGEREKKGRDYLSFKEPSAFIGKNIEAVRITFLFITKNI